jgi:hypothetical protein
MNTSSVISVRKQAEDCVRDMNDGPLKVVAFYGILQSLLAGAPPREQPAAIVGQVQSAPGQAASSFAERIGLLVDSAFFGQPRSLVEIQAALAERGWFYEQRNLSTPLVRLVRQRRLRRISVPEGNKRIWKYSLP